MKIIPSAKAEFTTDLSTDEVYNILKKNVQPRKFLSFDIGKKEKIPFEGSVEKNQFNIQRNINYKNSFIPQIIGTFTNERGKTKISVNLKLLNLVYFFVILLIGFSLFILLMGIYFNRISDIDFIIFPLGFIIFTLLLTRFGFYIEKNKSLEKLKEVLQIKN